MEQHLPHRAVVHWQAAQIQVDSERGFVSEQTALCGKCCSMLKNWKALFIELVSLLYLFSAIACNLVVCRKDV